MPRHHMRSERVLEWRAHASHQMARRLRSGHGRRTTRDRDAAPPAWPTTSAHSPKASVVQTKAPLLALSSPTSGIGDIVSSSRSYTQQSQDVPMIPWQGEHGHQHMASQMASIQPATPPPVGAVRSRVAAFSPIAPPWGKAALTDWDNTAAPGAPDFQAVPTPPSTPRITRLPTPDLEPLAPMLRFCAGCPSGAEEHRYREGRAKMDSQRESHHVYHTGAVWFRQNSARAPRFDGFSLLRFI